MVHGAERGYHDCVIIHLTTVALDKLTHVREFGSLDKLKEKLNTGSGFEKTTACLVSPAVATKGKTVCCVRTKKENTASVQWCARSEAW